MKTRFWFTRVRGSCVRVCRGKERKQENKQWVSRQCWQILYLSLLRSAWSLILLMNLGFVFNLSAALNQIITLKLFSESCLQENTVNLTSCAVREERQDWSDHTCVSAWWVCSAVDGKYIIHSTVSFILCSSFIPTDSFKANDRKMSLVLNELLLCCRGLDNDKATERKVKSTESTVLRADLTNTLICYGWKHK